MGADESCPSLLLALTPAIFFAIIGFMSRELPGTLGLPNVSSLRVLLSPSLLRWRLYALELTGGPCLLPLADDL